MSFLRMLRSPRLALGLCLAAALYAALGTLWQVEPVAARLPGLAKPYANAPFLCLILLLAANLSACTWHRMRVVGRPFSGADASRRFLDLLVHLSLLLMLVGGALKGGFGSVSTQYLFPGTVVETTREGGTGPEASLGFGLLLLEIVEEHFPLALQVRIRDLRTGASLGVATIREGRGTEVAGGRQRLEVGPYEAAQDRVTVRVLWPDGKPEDLHLDTVPAGRSSGRAGNLEVELLAWRRDLRTVRGRVAVVEGGQVVAEQWLAPNERILWRGSSVLLTAWGEDPYRNRYLGVQVVRDPGAPLFWVGAVLFGLATPAFMAARHRHLSLRRTS